MLRGFREEIEAQIPELERLANLETQDKLENLMLTDIEGFLHHSDSTGTLNLSLNYHSIGTEKTFPNVRSKLIREGLVKEHQIRTVSKNYLQELIHINCLRKKVSVYLEINNPNYAQ